MGGPDTCPFFSFPFFEAVNCILTDVLVYFRRADGMDPNLVLPGLMTGKRKRSASKEQFKNSTHPRKI